MKGGCWAQRSGRGLAERVGQYQEIGKRHRPVTVNIGAGIGQWIAQAELAGQDQEVTETDRPVSINVGERAGLVKNDGQAGPQIEVGVFLLGMATHWAVQNGISIRISRPCHSRTWRFATLAICNFAT